MKRKYVMKNPESELERRRAAGKQRGTLARESGQIQEAQKLSRARVKLALEVLREKEELETLTQ